MVALREVSTSSRGRSPATSRAASIRFPMKVLRRRQLLALSLRKCRCSLVRGPTFSESSSLLKPAITVIGVRSSWLTTVSSSSRSLALRSTRAYSSSSSRFARSRWWLSRWTSASSGSKPGQVLDLPPALPGASPRPGSARHRERVLLPAQQPALDGVPPPARDPVGTPLPRPSPACRGPALRSRTPSPDQLGQLRIRPGDPAAPPSSRPTERPPPCAGPSRSRTRCALNSPGSAMLSPDRAAPTAPNCVVWSFGTRMRRLHFYRPDRGGFNEIPPGLEESGAWGSGNGELRRSSGRSGAHPQPGRRGEPPHPALPSRGFTRDQRRRVRSPVPGAPAPRGGPPRASAARLTDPESRGSARRGLQERRPSRPHALPRQRHGRGRAAELRRADPPDTRSGGRHRLLRRAQARRRRRRAGVRGGTAARSARPGATAAWART